MSGPWKSTSGGGGSFAEPPLGWCRAVVYELEDQQVREDPKYGQSRALMWKFQTEHEITESMFPDGQVNEEALGKRCMAVGYTNLNLDGSPKLNDGKGSKNGNPSNDYKWCIKIGVSPEQLAAGIDPERDIIGRACFIEIEQKGERRRVTSVALTPAAMEPLELRREDLRRDPGYYVREEKSDDSFDYGANAEAAATVPNEAQAVAPGQSFSDGVPVPEAPEGVE